MQTKFLLYGEVWKGVSLGNHPGEIVVSSINTKEQGRFPYGISGCSLLASELINLGYDVDVFDFCRIIPDYRDKALLGRVKRRLLLKYYDYKINTTLLETVRRLRPDYLIVFEGLNIKPKTLVTIKNMGVKLVNWSPDDFLNKKSSNANLLDSIKCYDFIVSTRTHRYQKYRDIGAPQIINVNWYYVHELHYHRDNQLKYHLTFVGNWSPYREDFMSKIQTPMVIWGNGWHKSSKKFKTLHEVRPGEISPVEMSFIFSSSKYNLNVLTPENHDLINLRAFEVCASGGLLLTDRVSYLIDGEDCLMFNSPEEVNDLLTKIHNCSAIAQQGQLKVINGKNAFSDRAQQLLGLIT